MREYIMGLFNRRKAVAVPARRIPTQDGYRLSYPTQAIAEGQAALFAGKGLRISRVRVGIDGRYGFDVYAALGVR
jgi:hypothetical protein